MVEKLKEFWEDVEAERKVQAAMEALRWQEYQETGDTAALEGQTERGALFITSLPNRNLGREWVAGRVCGVFNMTLAARRIVEQSHRPSTAAEIAEFLATSRRNYEAMAAAEQRREGRSSVLVEPQAPAGKGGAR